MQRFPSVIWLTGLSGAGKSTLAKALSERIRHLGRRVEVLDGDEVRQNLWPELGFCRADRDVNVRRIGYLASVLAKHGIVVIVAAVSPYRQARAEALARFTHAVEIHVHCPLDVLVQRDTKGLYRRALAGEIKALTGVDDPYEEPLWPAVKVDTSLLSADACCDHILSQLCATALSA